MKVNKKRRFNNLSEQSKKITELINNGQIRLAREIVLELMNKYPKDEILKAQFARINILEKNYEDALFILEQLDEKKTFIKLVSLYIELNYEDRLYELYKKYFCDEFYRNKYNDEMKYRLLDIYLNKKFNSNYSLNIDKVSYFEKQIYSYNRELAIEHIKEGHLDYTLDKAKFVDDVNIDNLYDKVNEFIKNNLNKGNLIQNISKSFYFYMPGIGENKDKVKFNYLFVCTIAATNEIITMFPVNMRKNNDYLILDKIDDCDINMVKVKKRVKSGLERFNDRYKIN